MVLNRGVIVMVATTQTRVANGFVRFIAVAVAGSKFPAGQALGQIVGGILFVFTKEIE
jgi:hypothetical protein